MTDRDAPHARTARFGYRGRALTLVGVVWILVGLQVLDEPDRIPLLSDWLPPWLRAAVWIATGTVALVTAWWPPGGDKWGFMALTVPATIRAIAYAWSAALGAVGLDIGNPGHWTGAVSWTVVVAVVLLLSSWPEPVHLHPPEGAS